MSHQDLVGTSFISLLSAALVLPMATYKLFTGFDIFYNHFTS